MTAFCALYAGPAGTGKTRELTRVLAEEAIREKEERFFLIVPEQSASAYEKRMIEMGDTLARQPGYLNVDIIGFRRLGYRVFADAGIPADRVLEEYEKSILVRAAAGRVKKELELYRNSLDKAGFTRELKSLFSEFMQFDIRLEDVEAVIRRMEEKGETDERIAKFRDIRRIYQAFREIAAFRTDGSLAEERDKVLGDLLMGDTPLPAVDGASFFFDDFRGYTPDQFRILEGLSRRAKKMVFTLTIEPQLLAPDRSVPAYDRFHQSYETWKSLTAHCGKMQLHSFRRTDRTRAFRAKEISHIEEFGFSFPGKPYEGPREGAFQIWQCEDPEEELQVILEDMHHQARKGVRYRNMAVIAGNAEELQGLTERVFRQYFTPVFMDMGRKGENNPFTDALMRLLEISEKDFDYESIFGFLKTGVLSPQQPEDFLILENEVIRLGIRGGRLWEKEGLFQDPAAERGRRTFMDRIGKELAGLKNAGNAAGFTDALLKLLGPDHLDFEKKVEELAQRMMQEGRTADYLIYSGFYGKLETLIKRTGAILGAEEMPLREYRDILASGIPEMRLSVIPPTMDAVLVGDPSRTRPGEVDTLYLMEMNEGILPSGRKNQPILNEMDRRLLSEELSEKGKTLAPDEEGRSAEEMLAIYRTMAIPAKRLILLYTLQDRAGAEREKSGLVNRILRLFPGMEPERKTPEAGVSRRADAARFSCWLRQEMEEGDHDNQKKILTYLDTPRRLQWVQENLLSALEYENGGTDLPREVMENLPITISVSQLEQYAGCPYSYFLKYILRLEERKVHAISQLDVGNLMHRTLELSGKEIRDIYGNDWQGLSDGMLREMAERNMEKALAEAGRESAAETDGKTENILTELKNLSAASLLRMREHISAGEFRPRYFEQAFTASFSVKKPDGRPGEIRINGKIDRADLYEAEDRIYVRILDYKTGNKDFIPQEIVTGTAIQLPAYTDMVCRILGEKFPGKEIIPCGMYYMPVRRPVMDKPGPKLIDKMDGDMALAAEEQLRKEQRLRGLTNDSPDEWDAPDRYRLLELQEKETVDASTRALRNGRVIPLEVTKEGEFTAATAAVDTAGARNCVAFGSHRMKELTETILTGSMRKTPVQYGNKEPVCSYCSYASVCRRGIYSDQVNKVKKPEGTLRDQLSLMRPLEETAYSNIGFLEDRKDGKVE